MLTTLANVRAELKAVSTVDDNLINAYVRKVTARILRLGGAFEPQFDTRYFTPTSGNTGYWNGVLELLNPDGGQQYLLWSNSDTPVISRNGQNLVWNTDVLPYPQSLNPVTPVKYIRLSDVNGQIFQTWYPRSIPPIYETVTVQGWWGIRQYYGTMGWLTSLQTVQDNPLLPTATTLTVTNINAPDSLGRVPTFSAGNLIRIEGEVLQVISTNTVANTIGVQRGMNGTTAVAHNQNTAITIWEPEEDITQVATRQAALMYARRGAFDQVTIQGIAATVYPRDLLAELTNVLQGYAYL